MNNKRIYYDFEFCNKRVTLSRKFVKSTNLVDLCDKNNVTRVNIDREMESIAYEVIKHLLDYGIVSSMSNNIIRSVGFCLIETYYFRDIIVVTLEQLSRYYDTERFDKLCLLKLIKYNINNRKRGASTVIIGLQIMYCLFEYLQIDDIDCIDLLNSVLDVNMSTPCFEWYRDGYGCANTHIHSVVVRDISITKTKILERLNENKQLKLYNKQLLRMMYKHIIPSSSHLSNAHVSITTALYNIRIK